MIQLDRGVPNGAAWDIYIITIIYNIYRGDLRTKLVLYWLKTVAKPTGT